MDLRSKDRLGRRSWKPSDVTTVPIGLGVWQTAARYEAGLPAKGAARSVRRRTALILASSTRAALIRRCGETLALNRVTGASK